MSDRVLMALPSRDYAVIELPVRGRGIQMRAEFAFLCTAAQKQSNGLYEAKDIGVSRFVTPSVPLRKPPISFIFRLRYEPAEIGEHTFTIGTIDADGKNPVPVSKHPLILDAPESGEEGQIFVAYSGDTLVFPEFGMYSIHLWVDDKVYAKIPFDIVRGTQPPLEPSPQSQGWRGLISRLSLWIRERFRFSILS